MIPDIDNGNVLNRNDCIYAFITFKPLLESEHKINRSDQ